MDASWMENQVAPKQHVAPPAGHQDGVYSKRYELMKALAVFGVDVERLDVESSAVVDLAAAVAAQLLRSHMAPP